MKVNAIVSVLAATVAIYAAPAVISDFEAKAAQGLRLLSFSEDTEPVWMSEDEKLEVMRAHTQFFDLTEVAQLDIPSAAKSAVAAIPAGPTKQALVNPILSTLSVSRMNASLTSLTSFNNRYYKASTGAAASAWIVDTVSAIAKNYTYINATVASFKHSFVESSIIAKVPGSSSGPVTIIGAHMDSINLNSPTSGRAPGADDDGSGTVNLIEIFRALLDAGFKPKTPVEFHWYAGEEGGLLGSQDIAANYASAGVDVQAMMELDMTAYFRPGSTETVALMTDYTDATLNQFVRNLVTEYLRIGWTNGRCGYACSDHASWDARGYPSVVPFETILGTDNPNIHSSSDTTAVNGFSWTHSLEFTKLGLAYIYELTA